MNGIALITRFEGTGRGPYFMDSWSSPDYARDPDSSGLGIRKNAVAL